tara:strand:- start:251 stop:427 length:177 start_codon:yes stop_codon:yes gene_type:complete
MEVQQLKEHIIISIIPVRLKTKKMNFQHLPPIIMITTKEIIVEILKEDIIQKKALIGD